MMATMEKKESVSSLERLLERARKCDNKGRMYVYESFKNELRSMNISPEEYERTCRKLAQYLKV